MSYTVLRSSPALKLSALLLACTLAGCGGEDSKKEAGKGGSSSSGEKTTFVTPTGDTSVKPKDGGPGFEGEGWEPTEQQPTEGSTKAVKGGAVRYWVGAFPATLRPLGKDSNTTTNSLIGSLCYQRLLSIHSDTLEYVPSLASHWQISD